MKEYRQNSHTFSLAFWAVLCTATAIVLFIHSHKIVSRALRTEEILAGIALLIFGPVALVVYLIRARMVWVRIDGSRGLLVGDTRTISWEDIRVVERRRPSFRKSSGPAETPNFDPNGMMGQVGGGCVEVGCWTGLSEFFLAGILIVAALFAIWLIFFLFVPLVLLPLFEVFAPFGDRIKVVTRRGTLVLRDLSDADEFMRSVAQHRPVSEV